MLSKWDVAYTLFTAWYCWAAIGWMRVTWFMVCPPNPPGKLRSKWIVASYDMWVGAFLDRSNKKAYWFPIPFVGRKYWREVPASSAEEKGKL